MVIALLLGTVVALLLCIRIPLDRFLIQATTATIGWIILIGLIILFQNYFNIFHFQQITPQRPPKDKKHLILSKIRITSWILIHDINHILNQIPTKTIRAVCISIVAISNGVLAILTREYQLFLSSTSSGIPLNAILVILISTLIYLVMAVLFVEYVINPQPFKSKNHS